MVACTLPAVDLGFRQPDDEPFAMPVAQGMGVGKGRPTINVMQPLWDMLRQGENKINPRNFQVQNIQRFPDAMGFARDIPQLVAEVGVGKLNSAQLNEGVRQLIGHMNKADYKGAMQCARDFRTPNPLREGNNVNVHWRMCCMPEPVFKIAKDRPALGKLEARHFDFRIGEWRLLREYCGRQDRERNRINWVPDFKHMALNF